MSGGRDARCRVSVGALTIGQSPRPDLVLPLRRALPHAEVTEAGALDGLTAYDLPESGEPEYPLTTRLRDGSSVTVEESAVVPLLQGALDRLEGERDVLLTCLLCAGAFSQLRARRPLVNPFETGAAVLRALGMRRIGVICPFEEQRGPSTKKWEQAGFDPDVRVYAAKDLSEGSVLVDPWLQSVRDAVVLDYVGHSEETRIALGKACSSPVLDLGALAISVVAGMLQAPAGGVGGAAVSGGRDRS